MSAAPSRSRTHQPPASRKASARETLLRAVDDIPGDDLTGSLATVARALPIATGIEVVMIRLRDSDGQRLFHLVAMEGLSPRECRARALNPISLPSVKSQAALGPAHTLSQALGLRWLHASWIHIGGEPAGVIFAGFRTERRASEQARRLIGDVCERLAVRLRKADRTEAALGRVSRRIARDAALVPETQDGELATLRPRERMIVSLYAEGLAVEEIAGLLIISPHTVRTHVKNAFRRLGVHSRKEVAQLAFADEVRRLL